MTPDGAKALPCPFCGSNQTGFITFNSVWACYDCESETGLASTEQEALKVWNRRTPDPATQMVVEAAKVFLGGIDEERIYDNDHLKELREAVEALAGREGK